MSNRKKLLLLHPVPTLPFEKVSADILKFVGRNYSKWLEIVQLSAKQSSSVFNALKGIFCTHGIPRIIVTDHMPFNSFECQSFAKEYEFEFCTSSPHYHQSNDMPEKDVGIAKDILHKSTEAGKEYWLALMEYRNTPLAGLEYAPQEHRGRKGVLAGSNGVPQHPFSRSRVRTSTDSYESSHKTRIPVATNNLVSMVVPKIKMELASKQLQLKK
ncbi:hypothetical protein PR048_005933 [Dryococelus australis]|uniref:Integrase catalytic domain-containing protein n=1 Tax=Dryococelus australis TaxID=614101 RepID=A0ABQ9I9J7_9NEOP|nr:hypothetical protein PR048_005933 [Dryococelus australis]